MQKFIAYFQTFTNTYAPIDKLKELYDEALGEEDVIGLSVGTRPDCVSDGIIDLLRDYARKRHIWLELGLQSIHDKTLRLINRGHSAAAFLDALHRLTGSNIDICAHIIVGLPGENGKISWILQGRLQPSQLMGSRYMHSWPSEGLLLVIFMKKGQSPCLAGTIMQEQ